MKTESASRRAFVKTTAAGTVVAAASGAHAVSPDKVEVWILHGKDNRKLMEKAMGIVVENGGFGPHVETLALKVNAAWGREPEVGANTHPELIDVFLKNAKAGGVKKITIPEHPCSAAKIAFDRSGIEKVAKKHKCRMIDLKKKQKSFRKVEIPGGRKLKEAEVAGEYLDADAVVNMPVAKHHSGATVSAAMKNWMGIVKDRRHWHRTDLHQCIADFSTFIKPAWTIVDATRVMMDHGPQGPAENLKMPHLLILSKDQVAADACVMDIFERDPMDIKYLKYAGEMGIGVVDKSLMNIHNIEVG
ncbi:DUF362 domain-containing protein [Pontiella agarivorans]|uniref:DUF362 domain-containing protein n=1 Tax=Pontiella agarivorans TaxID=3038953 RepID=A0ABU5N1H2_9BACT|nr:DUF362 domain-containing protein [Pontiella agarivorans]MDZ8120302.1 DUF362 domain-containing protein [Pontiella agarivorans]